MAKASNPSTTLRSARVPTITNVVRKTDRYDDFHMLPADTDDEIVFFGGKDYLPLFCKLTAPIRSTKTVFYSSGNPPRADGCKLRRFETATRTNWHYECANAFLNGSIDAW
jgi:hypothetical protein